MSSVYFFVVDESGYITKSGTCSKDDVYIQGENVISSEFPLDISEKTHRFDLSKGEFFVIDGEEPVDVGS